MALSKARKVHKSSEDPLAAAEQAFHQKRAHLLRRYALAHPTVRFHLTLDGHPSLHTSGAGLEAATRTAADRSAS